ncbi:DNA processing protein DprA [Jiangella alkaliphila]|uniref:DNA processing protein n=1 Tax=Jiangella alkaliphila TaxID=419479 RepID=A0A1H2L851_9ACTN|nr:DNA processing protein DprA [Jiangella alkaliphila]SDU77109.1 DNA processing protein [Jiangella alkaliphila]
MTSLTHDASLILRIVSDGDRERLARIALAMIPANADEPMPSPEGGEAESRLRVLLTHDPHCLDAGRFRAVLNATAEQGLDVLIPGDDGWPISSVDTRGELWPPGLSDLRANQPVALWARGDITLLTRPMAIRVVLTGSRAASHYGERVASDITHDLAKSGYILTTGGQFGIDAAAHRAAASLDAPSIAVLPAGLDRLHPTAHGQLFDSVIDTGGLLLTEAAPGTPATRAAILRRGRIMAALARTTVIVEAAERSATLPIAQQAIALWRVVGAVPGPVTSATSAGCHQLLKDGDTHLITNANDIIDLIDRPKS